MKFIFKSLIVLVIVVIIDFATGFLYDKILANLPNKDTYTSNMYHSLFSNKADILVLGPSSARHHYNTKILKDSFHLDVYNAGFDGTDIAVADYVLKSYIDRYPPKIVLVDIGISQLDGKWLNRTSEANMFYGKNEFLTAYYNEKLSFVDRIKLKSSLYRYNSTLDKLIALYVSSDNTSFGYAPLTGSVKDLKRSYINDIFIVNEDELHHLSNIVDDCAANNIKLYFILSPREKICLSFEKWIENFAKEKGICFINENINPYYDNHYELFRDDNHLNGEGADYFTNRICEILNSED